MANSLPAGCTIPSFLILKLNSRTEIFLARIHLVCQKLIEIIHLLDKKDFFAEKNSFRQQTNNFVKSICFLRPWRRKYFFSREEENVLFKVSLRPARLFFSIFKTCKILYSSKPDKIIFVSITLHDSRCSFFVPKIPAQHFLHHFDSLNPGFTKSTRQPLVLNPFL